MNVDADRPDTAPQREVPREVAAGMSDPGPDGPIERYESELAGYFGVDHAVAVSSGTAALHCALRAGGIGAGDEVLVPALSVVMSVAPIRYVGAVPVFVDCGADGVGLDFDDLLAKLTNRSRAVLPVHLWGRVGDIAGLAELAEQHGLRVIEDACQAIGTCVDGYWAGTVGDFGCFSTKDGKILASGEGGFVLTGDGDLAERSRAFRTHWQTPPPGQAPYAELAYNYRLAEPLAAIARDSLARLDDLLGRRRHQSRLLVSLLADTPGLVAVGEGCREAWNRHCPLLRVGLPRPRQFSTRLAELGVANSVGTFGLMAAELRPVFREYARTPCLRAREVIDTTLAVAIGERDGDDHIHSIAATITKEAIRWGND
ncbi:MAG: DegT/DnrJ/EryC1/StrS family aminotransferase [Pseudonocardiaceae bacterium]